MSLIFVKPEGILVARPLRWSYEVRVDGVHPSLETFVELFEQRDEQAPRLQNKQHNLLREECDAQIIKRGFLDGFEGEVQPEDTVRSFIQDIIRSKTSDGFAEAHANDDRLAKHQLGTYILAWGAGKVAANNQGEN